MNITVVLVCAWPLVLMGIAYGFSRYIGRGQA